MARAPATPMQYEPLTASTGRVVVCSVVTRVRAVSADWIISRILEQVQRLGDSFDLIDTLRSAPGARYDVGDRDQEPDNAFLPSDAAEDGCAFLTLVVEVAYTYELWQLLTEKLELWLGPSMAVQVAIGIKVSKHDHHLRAIILFRRDGAAPQVQVVEFDARRSPAPALLRFPLRALYHGVAISDALEGHESDEIRIDLVKLRE